MSFLFIFFFLFLLFLFAHFLYVRKRGIPPTPAPAPAPEPEPEPEATFNITFAPAAKFDDLGEKYLTVRVKAEIGEGELVDRIPEEEAICEICWCLVKVGTSVLMTTCGGCKPILVHAKCNLDNYKRKENENCDVCELVIQHTAVTLSRVVYEEEEDNLKNVHVITSPKRSGTWISGLLKRK